VIIGDLILRNARDYPDKPAIRCAGREVSFAQFNDRVNRLTDALLRSGLKKGDRVAVLTNNSQEMLEIYGVAEKSGLIAVPLNWRLTAGELLTLIRDARPAALFVQERYVGRIDEVRPLLKGIIQYVAIGGASGDWADYQTLLASGSDEEPAVTVDEDDVVYFIYTSGTTGTPRAAMHTHGGQLAHARYVVEACGITPTDVNLNVMPLFHIGGHAKRLAHSARGCLNIIHDSFDVVRVLQTLADEKVTFVHLVPSMIAMLLALPDVGRYDLSSLRTLFYAASPMPLALLRRALDVFGPIFVQSYGQSEAGPSVTLLGKADHIDTEHTQALSRLSSAGRAVPGVDLQIRDAADRPAERGSVGEICARSPFLMQGYWEKPKETAEALKGGWLHTGDMGFLDEDGFLYVVDRKKDMIISGGENIYPREVEEVLYSHPAVLEAAVIGVPDDKWVEAVKAIVVLRKGSQASEAEIIAHCKAHLASYKKPKIVEFRTHLPKSPAGKVLKRELREER